MPAPYIGQPVLRKEDPRLLRGSGLFAADVRPTGVAEAVILRSIHPHALLRTVHLERARQAPGVLAAFCYDDLREILQPLPMLAPHKLLNPRMPYPLAREKVRYVGEPIAVLVAEDRYLAEDALELIEVDYEPLEPVPDVFASLAEGAPLLHPDLGSNVAARFDRGIGDIDDAFRRADQVVRLSLSFPRATGQPIEARGLCAEPGRNRFGPTLTVWDAAQSAHTTRRLLAEFLDLPLENIHYKVGDVGGGFGTKNRFYAEQFLVPYLALRLKRPVRWISDRQEDLVSTYQSRQQEQEVEAAFCADGTLLGVKLTLRADQGAYTPYGMINVYNTVSGLPGTYRVPAMQAIGLIGFTNKPGVAPYRSGGGPPMAWIVERVMDAGARALGLDPLEIRRRNVPDPSEFPRASGLTDRDGTPITYDSGQFRPCLEAAVEALELPTWRAEQARRRELGGPQIGIGLSVYRESGGRGFESASVRVQPSGRVLVATGATPQGQGLETTLAQICADRLGVDLSQVSVVTGDTDAIPLGMGTFASRSAIMAGNAVSQAALEVRAKALAMGARLLEVGEADLELTDGRLRVRGAPERQLSLADLARTLSAPSPAMGFPFNLEPDLESMVCYVKDGGSSGGGAHGTVVEVDPETCQVTILRYVVAHDCGVAINPAIVAGQVQGAVGQGVGTALFEDAAYSPDGQPLAGSLMDYLLPGACEVPTIAERHANVPAPGNPEGIKPVGEGGTVPAPAVLASAIDDALQANPIRRAPMTPDYLRSLMMTSGPPPQ